MRVRKLSLWILLILLLVGTLPAPARADETAKPSPLRRQWQSIAKHKTAICVGLVAAHVIAGISFYAGVKWGKPTDRIVLTANDTVPDHPSFAVTEVRQAFALVDGVVKDGTGNTLPGSERTRAIAAFREHVLRLDEDGVLSVYRPRFKTWVPLQAPSATAVVALQNEILVLSSDGEVLQYRDEEGELLAFNENRALVGGKPIAFQRLGSGFRTLISQTPNGFFHPETALAIGDEALVIKTLVPAQRIEKDSPERKAIAERLGL